jgi:adenine-specific DNA-methyltransferase
MATGNSKTKWNSQDITGEITPAAVSTLGIRLEYEGKLTEEEILTTKPAATKAIWSGSADSQNRLYYGDNLPILAALLQDAQVSGQVKLVYIDPPYATNSVFHSRTQADAYQDLLVGPHYLEFMRQRLILLRQLLANDGAIYVHLDENMAFHVKIILDEVFGVRNFRNWITRKKCNPKNTTRKRYGDISDYILFYTKTDEYIWNRPVVEWTDETAKKEYNCIDPETGRRYKKVPVHAPGTRNGTTGGLWKGKLPPPGKHWQYTPNMLDEMDARGEIYWSPNGNPRRKIYLDNSAGVPVQDIWLDFPDIRNQNTRITGYPTEKNPDLITRIIEASSHPGDLVLDCFAGSGTTLVEASRLQRRWIGIDNSTEALATILRRFAIGSEPMGDFVEKVESKQTLVPQTLFDYLEAEEETQLHTTTKPVHTISDFTLFVNSLDAAHLTPILADWQEQQATKTAKR